MALADDELHAVGVGVGQPALHGDFVPAIRMKLGGPFHGNRAAVVHVEGPLGDVEVVGAEVRHLAAGVVPEEAEVVVNAQLVVRTLRSGAEPEVVVEFGGRGGIRRPAGRRS